MQNTYIKTHLTLTECLLGSTSGDPLIHSRFQQNQLKDAALAAEELSAHPNQTPNQPTDEELAEVVERSSTVFFSDQRGLFLFDYQIRGFLKEATLALIELGEQKEVSKWAYKKVVDSFVFVYPRRIYLMRPTVDLAGLPNQGMWEERKKIAKTESLLLIDIEDVDKLAKWSEWCYQRPEQDATEAKKFIPGVTALERPLRGQTPRGERIALARSECVEEGVQLAFMTMVMLPGEAPAPVADAKGKVKPARKSAAGFNLDHIRNCFDYGIRKGLLQWRGGGWGRFNWTEVIEEAAAAK
jgi:hypothetical protein